ncbi:MAG TPA: hypothetical protein VKA49_18170 [Flavitalea sp.]|nr:hypothetical protein [Flavitalea sp.]
MDHSYQHSKKWYNRQTEKEIILPVEASIAKQRLQYAFSSPLIISKGLLYATEKYTGQVNENNEIDVQLTFRWTPNMRYSMHGQLFPDSKGSRMVMTVKDKSSLLIVLLAILAIIFFNYKQMGFKQIGFALIIVILAIPFMILSSIWHRNWAANVISQMIYKVVSNPA